MMTVDGVNTGSSCFFSALLCGVDLLCLVLLHMPLSVWTDRGLHRERGRESMETVHRELCLPLMQMAGGNVSVLKTQKEATSHFTF